MAAMSRTWSTFYVVGWLAMLHTVTMTTAWSNGAAIKPPMGWANWNNFGCNYTDALLRDMADAFVSSGLAGVGASILDSIDW